MAVKHAHNLAQVPHNRPQLQAVHVMRDMIRTIVRRIVILAL